jgi:hypothetical protein
MRYVIAAVLVGLAGSVFGEPGSSARTALIDRIEWGATDVHGRIFEASLMDIQDTVFKEKLVSEKVPLGRIAPAAWVGEVAASLGPFRLLNDDGAPGCR